MQNSVLEKAAVRKVKLEVDSIIENIRGQLQSYVEDESDISSLEEVSKLLIQIERTLQLIQINGAAVLAREMKEVVDSLVTDSIKQKDKAQETLSRGILQMSDYLEYVQAGHKDVPIVLLPLLNDLRGVREAPLLSEHFLFFPNLDDIDVPDVSVNIGMSAQDYAKKIRYGFQIGLVSLIQNKEINDSSTKICKVCIRLHQCSNEIASRRLWWITSAVAQAIAIEGLATSAGLASLLGQVDRQIKKFVELDEASFAKDIPLSLIKNLLYYVGIAQDRGRIVTKVKAAYGLDDLIPNEDAIEQMREGIAGPNVDVLEAVSKALHEDIANVKDAIELYVHSENRSAESVTSVQQDLQKIADTLSMLGLEEPREDVMREAATLKSLSQEELDHADSSFVKVAEVLIKAENIVENFVNYRVANKPAVQVVGDEDGKKEDVDAQVEMNQLKKIQVQTLSEALNELEDAKDVISQILSSPDDEENLLEVQNILQRIIGALSILKLDDAASILENVQAFLLSSEAAEQLSSNPEKLDAFADSVTSVECYIEAIIVDEGDPDDILKYGMESISRLVGNQAKNSGNPASLETIAVDDLAENGSDLQLEDDGLGKKNNENAVDPSLEDLSATSMDLSFDANLFADSPSEPEQHSENPSSPEDPDKVDEDLEFELPPLDLDTDSEVDLQSSNSSDEDDELLPEIAELQSTNIKQTESELPILDAEKQADDAPGSSEDDELSPELAELQETSIHDAETELSTFIGEKEKETDITNADTETIGVVEVDIEETNSLDLDEIEEELNSSIQNANVDNSSSDQNEEESNQSNAYEDEGEFEERVFETQLLPREVVDHAYKILEYENKLENKQTNNDYSIHVNEKGAQRDLIVIKESTDDEILEIFIEEAEEEFQKISRNLPAWQNNLKDDEALISTRRSFHTLKGSGRLVGAEIIGEFAWLYENVLNKVIENSIEVTDELNELLGKSIEALQQLILQLKSGKIPSINVQSLVDSLQEFVVTEEVKETYSEQADTVIQEIDPQAFISNEDEDNISETDDTVLSENFADIEEFESVAEDCQSNDDFDNELYEIFIQEADHHLINLEAIISENSSSKTLTVNDSLLQPVHTLLGSARTAGVTAISDVCGPLDKFCLECSQHGQIIKEQSFDVVATCIDYFRNVINVFAENKKFIEADQDLIEQINKLKPTDIPVLEEIISADESKSEEIKEDSIPVLSPETDLVSKKEFDNADRYEDKDPDLAEIFLEEAHDILQTCNECMGTWQANRDEENAVSEFRRQLHTLKGSARMAAYMNIGDFSHAIESLVIAIAEHQLDLSEHIFSLLQNCLDAISEMIEEAVAKQPVYPAQNLIDEINAVRGVDSTPEDDQAVSDQAFAAPADAKKKEQEVEDEKKEPVNIPVLKTLINKVQEPKSQPVVATQQAIRLQADMLDNLVNNAGEVNIFQARLEQVTNKYTSNIEELEQVVNRLREQLRSLELETEAQILSRHAHETPNHEDFDPLEMDRYSDIQQLSRSLAESANDLLSIKDILFDQTRESEMILLQQNRISNDLQEGLMRTRMVQFGQLVPRMQRIVRQTARELDKDADLKVIGAETEVDSSILNKIVAPLEHLIRNAVSHGIEDKDRRQRTKKPKSGEIIIAVNREGAEIVIEVSDDGAGIDPEKVKKKALELGLIENENIPEREVFNLILTPGFSTAGKVTQVSGRGVGMDVVASDLKQLGGYLQINSVLGEGAMFTIRIPFTLAIAQALLIKSGDESFAVPLVSVEGVVRLSAYELRQKYEDDNATYHYADKDYQLRHLGTLLDICPPQLDGADNMYPVLLVRSGETRLAIHVEETLSNREIVVKPLVSQLSRIPSVSGATILGDGSVVLILDIQGLLRIDVDTQPDVEEYSDSDKQKLPTILIVDDSITIRKVTTRFLERNNFKATTAKDGVDAVQKLQEFKPDLILLDIEMPRMDGYELATHVRNSARLKDVPIIMITSRTGEKHRKRALDIGVQMYLGKPYNESELLSHIKATIH